MKFFLWIFIISFAIIQEIVFGKVEINSNTCCNVGTEGQTKYDEKLKKLMQDCIQELGLAGMYFICQLNIVNHFEAIAITEISDF